MLWKFILIDSDKMSDTSYCAMTLNFDLVPRSQEYIYASLWYELSRDDYETYRNLSSSANYLKVLDNLGRVVYSGVSLDEDELQHKLKVLTLENLPLTEGENE